MVVEARGADPGASWQQVTRRPKRSLLWANVRLGRYAPVNVSPPRTSPNEIAELNAILRDRRIRSVYQPIVDLASRRVVGYEGLARGPEGSSLESAPALLAAGRAAGRLFELDWECRFAAIEGAQRAGFPPWLRLFINIEPGSLTQKTDPTRLAQALDAVRDLTVIAEFTERALIDRTVEVIDAVEWLRSLRLGVALDDVGADMGSLALLPFICPDVVKLDMRLIRERPTGDVVAVANAVQAEVEQQGSIILAEGIETEAQLNRGLAMGARLGQGWLFGRPGAFPEEFPITNEVVNLLQRPPRAVDMTPFSLIRRIAPTRTGDPELLSSVSRYLEEQAKTIAGGAVILSCFQRGQHFGGEVRRRYQELAASAPLTAIFAVDVPTDLPPSVRGIPIAADDPLASEWVVAVIGPHFAAALIAREGAERAPRQFQFALTYQRDLVLDVGRALVRRLPRPSAQAT